jgi:C-terminal processing protease CtpA/Prc
MTRRILTAALALAVVLPTLATAQERQRSRNRDAVGSRPRVQVFGFNRARLGVTVQTKADPETDRYGARILSVVEDSPADEAGLKEGDIITRFGSTSLANAKPEDHDMDDDADASGPGLRLVELAQDLDEGDTVRVEYRRDGSNHTASIVAAEVGNEMSFYRFDDQNPGMGMVMPKFEGPRTFQFRGMPGDMQFFKGPDNFNFEGPGNFSFFMGGHGGLQMMEMNADLGEYFGTSEGLLVTAAPGDSSIPLRAGDVILSIDGRKPTSVAHAYRIIGSYDEGETVKAEVMRKHQRVNVEWKVEERETRLRSLRPSGRQLEREPRGDRTRM